ncbi:hypothetical protein DDB_G0277995 [Dictyostelium discoideum AX4]|uniref:Uncharacterized protein n=1 Tax=Dictyostelium discoideum TaxID=44689 RepID=Q54YZ2_DICDI|nr:hypothetical protein DDB_G0277995 [Dictyostelium discoideum AX4]EAL68170.1 hypothetical protein DDB_G0277995 [Dictyostelium discoideum AX4]|eukprot:XP_642060.1 hypothetical protein DDB_G0277995 [Dictyostelium discoideum AX4]
MEIVFGIEIENSGYSNSLGVTMEIVLVVLVLVVVQVDQQI